MKPAQQPIHYGLLPTTHPVGKAWLDQSDPDLQKVDSIGGEYTYMVRVPYTRGFCGLFKHYLMPQA